MSRSRKPAWMAGALSLALLMPLTLGACSSSSSGPPQLTWYINPDNGGQKTLAQKCSDQSDGKFTIQTQLLPNEADAQREQLVRRLAASDSSVDLMSLDPPFVAEFANAGYLRAITDPAEVKALTDGVLAAPLKTAYWKGALVATPFWANTQLLWYRKSVVEAAGVDPTAPNFTWADMIDAAEKTHKQIGVQGRRYEGYMVWVNALVASGGGEIVGNVDQGDKATPSVAGPAGDAAAEVVGRLARSSAAPSDLSTAGEEEARSLFQGDAGSFMVNWPYVYGAAKESVSKGAISQAVVDDIGWARYPEVTAGKKSAPPLGGINLAIGNFTKHPDEALAAVTCITSLEKFPMAPLIRDSINDAGPRPVTPYYGDVSSSVQRTWHPSTGVHPGSTPKTTDSYMAEVLSGKRLP